MCVYLSLPPPPFGEPDPHSWIPLCVAHTQGAPLLPSHHLHWCLQEGWEEPCLGREAV